MKAPGVPAADFLRALDLFSGLTDDELGELAATALPFEAPAGATLFRQGDEASDMYCMAEGTARVSVRLAGEEELEVARLGPGSVVGEMALVDESVRSASVRVVDAARGYRIERWSFDILRAAFRPSSYKVVHRLAELVSARLRAATQELLDGSGPSLMMAAEGDPPERIDRTPAPDGREGALDPDDLAPLPFFRGFTRAEMGELLTHLRRIDVPRRRLVFDQGDAADAAYVVLRGAVESRGSVPSGALKLALHGPGTVFGAEALFRPERRATRAVTREDTKLVQLDAERFQRLHREGAVVAYKLCDAATRLLVDALRGANRRRTWLVASGLGLDGVSTPESS
ncbi:MAG: cyclic nucleotide-binding domain-containing protein [Gemmatimonadota bacterium]|jgi:CRP-like cAMP-binding protein